MEAIILLCSIYFINIVELQMYVILILVNAILTLPPKHTQITKRGEKEERKQSKGITKTQLFIFYESKNRAHSSGTHSAICPKKIEKI